MWSARRRQCSCGAYSGVFALFSLYDMPTTEIYTLSLHDALPISTVIPVGVLRARASLPGKRAVEVEMLIDRKSTRLNSSHVATSYAVFCLKKKITKHRIDADTKRSQLSEQSVVESAPELRHPAPR